MKGFGGIACVLSLILGSGCSSVDAHSSEYLPPEDTNNSQYKNSASLYSQPKPIDEVEPMVLHEPDTPETRTKLAEVPVVTPTKVKEPNLGPAIPVKLVAGNPKQKKIALTFDDGPHKGFTEKLVELLKSLNVKATFFMIGRNVQASPELVKLSYDNGFEIANHTFTHSRLALLSDDSVRQELNWGADSIEKIIGVRPRFYRPPGGEYDNRVVKITQELGMTMVLWTSDAGDYTTVAGNPNATTILKKVMAGIRPGGIVIMHDPMPGTLQALPAIVASLRSQGYEFVTISELASDPNAVTKGGPMIKPNKDSAVQALVNQTGYPKVQTKEDTNASSKQGTKGTTTTEGTKGQGIDQGGQSRSQGWKQGQQIGPQTRESR